MATDKESKTHLIFLIADTFLTSEEQLEALTHLDDIYEQLKTRHVADIEVSSERVRDFIHIAYQIVKLGADQHDHDRTMH